MVSSKTLKIALTISILINIALIWIRYFGVQYRTIDISTHSTTGQSFHLWWYVEGINFKTPWVKWLEYYLLFWVPNNTITWDSDYFYLNGVTISNNWSSIQNDLRKLRVKLHTSDTLVLFDNQYTFTIDKISWSISWEDNHWKKFRLNPDIKTYWYQWGW